MGQNPSSAWNNGKTIVYFTRIRILSITARQVVHKTLTGQIIKGQTRQTVKCRATF